MTTNLGTQRLWQGLRSMGISASYDPVGDEAIAPWAIAGNDWSSAIIRWFYSLFVPPRPAIRIDLGAIQYIVVQRRTISGESSFEKVTIYEVEYIAPDQRLTAGYLSSLRIDSVIVRAFPLVGRVVGSRWEGKDLGLGVVEALNDLKSTNDDLVNAHSAELEVRIDTKRRCWILKIPAALELSIPTRTELECYRAVANCLLKTDVVSAAGAF